MCLDGAGDDHALLAVLQAQITSGLVFLDKALFTTYVYQPTQARNNINDNASIAENEGEEDDDPHPPVVFQVSLPALLEILQIFSAEISKDRSSHDPSNLYYTSTASFGPHRSTAFDHRVLGMAGVCHLNYVGPGDPFNIVLEGTGVTTTCELVTYEPELHHEIPLQRDKLAQKIIMRATWLHDAITELASTNPTRLTITASPSTAPYLALSAAGALGSATVEFSKDPQLLETFQVARRTVNTYKFSLIKNATKAMALASKVSIRVDEQGVLSLQFMIEFESGGVSFVDFRFVPFIPEEGDDEGEEVGEEEGQDESGDELG